MKLRTACVAMALIIAPTLSFSMGCSHGKQAMSCASGSTYDATTGTCVVDATT